MSEPSNGSGVEWSGGRANPAALIAAAFPQRQQDPADTELSALERIANALEAIAGRKNGCYGENPATGQACVLDEGHVGYHMPGDGREPWLDA